MAGLLHLRLLGEFSARQSDGTQVSIRGRKARGLLAFLALSGRQGITREKAIGLLWGDRYHEQAQASLRQALGEIRRDLNGAHQDVLMADRTTISISRQHVQIDADAFWTLSASDDPVRLSEALSFYGGDLLEGLNISEPAFEDWLRAERVRYAEQYRGTLRRLLAVLVERGDSGAVFDTARRLLAQDRTDEHGHRAMMRCYVSEGNRAHALRQYQVCADALRDEFQTVPSAETTALFEAIKRGRAATMGAGGHGALAVRSVLNVGPSVQVTPFATHSGNAEDGWLAAELASDVSAALGRFRWMSILATDSIRPETGVPPRETSDIGDSPARFILRGRLRRLPTGLSVAMELVDTVGGKTVWGEQLDSMIDPGGKYAPLLVSQIAGRTEARIRVHAAKTVRTKPQDMLDAFECTVGALHLIDEMSEDSFAHAANLFKRAKRLAPGFALPYSWEALWKIFCIGQGWSSRSAVVTSSPHELAREAMRLDPEDAIALAIAGHFEAFIFHQFDQALDLFDRALSFNPHCSFAWMLSAATHSYIGAPAEALRRLDLADAICPTDSQLKFMYNTARCIAHSFARSHEEAATWGRRAVRESPGFSNGLKLLLVNLGLLRRSAEAAQFLARLLELEPGFSRAKFAREYPFGRDEDREYFLSGLELAGLE